MLAELSLPSAHMHPHCAYAGTFLVPPIAGAEDDCPGDRNEREADGIRRSVLWANRKLS
jgi:hypothetical protein